MTVSPLAEGRLGAVIVHTNITERKQAEEQIRNLAYYDSLTRLPNRRMLDERLLQALASSQRARQYGALMLLDLDNFKPLNDTHGHGVGDLLLIEVAARLVASIREVDTVARLGGDEFVVVLGGLSAHTRLANRRPSPWQKIRLALARPYHLKAPSQTRLRAPSSTTAPPASAALCGRAGAAPAPKRSSSRQTMRCTRQSRAATPSISRRPVCSPLRARPWRVR